jgi:hypothetical protein
VLLFIAYRNDKVVGVSALRFSCAASVRLLNVRHHLDGAISLRAECASINSAVRVGEKPADAGNKRAWFKAWQTEC